LLWGFWRERDRERERQRETERDRERDRERERRARERAKENAHSTATSKLSKPAQPHQKYDWLVREKVADGALIAKWRKPGYEFLCSLLAIQRSGTNFGTTALCRVPLKQRTEQQRVSPSVQTGCVSCASCDAGKHDGPIWWDQLDDSDDEEEQEQGEGQGQEEARRRGEEQPAAAAAARREEEEEPSAKRARSSDAAAAAAAEEEEEEDEEELDEEVQKRLQALKEGGG
jgi:bud site selection protein 31